MTTPPPPQPPAIDRPPEMALIRGRRTALGLSYASAGTLAGISDTWWRLIEDGQRQLKGPKGLRTLARMADAVGVTPAEMEERGRPDVAAELAVIHDLAGRQDAGAREEAERMIASMTGYDEMSERQRSDLTATIAGEIRRMRKNS